MLERELLPLSTSSGEESHNEESLNPAVGDAQRVPSPASTLGPSPKRSFFLQPELFLYPLVLVLICVLVVLFFSGSAEDSRSIDQLILRLGEGGTLNQQGPVRAAFDLAQEAQEMERTGARLTAAQTERLIGVLDRSRSNPAIQRYLVRALGRVGAIDPVFVILQATLADPLATEDARIEAVCGLGLSRDARAVPALLAEIKREVGPDGWWMRVNATQGLMNIALKADPAVRSEIAAALEGLLGDPHVMVSWNVALFLAEENLSPAGLALLRQMLDVRFLQAAATTQPQQELFMARAVKGLGALRDEDSYAAIAALSKDNRSYKVKDAAIRVVRDWKRKA